MNKQPFTVPAVDVVFDELEPGIRGFYHSEGDVSLIVLNTLTAVPETALTQLLAHHATCANQDTGAGSQAWLVRSQVYTEIEPALIHATRVVTFEAEYTARKAVA